MFFTLLGVFHLFMMSAGGSSPLDTDNGDEAVNQARASGTEKEKTQDYEDENLEDVAADIYGIDFSFILYRHTNYLQFVLHVISLTKPYIGSYFHWGGGLQEGSKVVK